MASPPLLDFQAMLAPIPGENPAGDSVPYELRQKLEEDRKEDNPEEFAPDDPMRPEKFKKADWAAIIRMSKETLAQKSKDLLVAARLTEALSKQHGFGGLRDGLHLLRLLVENCWDRVNPPIEDGDVEVRVTPFVWLDDPDHGARFPSTLRTLPIIVGDERQFGWLDWRRSQDGQGSISQEDVEKAIQAAAPEHCRTVAEDIAQSLDELNQLTYKLNEKMGSSAPGLSGLRQALDGCAMLAQNIVQRKSPELAGEPAPDGKTGGAPSRPGRAPGSRDEAYRLLAQAAALLKQLEPHSPIPYLIQRAVELGAMPFPLLIKELIREPAILTELNRELGIKEAPPGGLAPPPTK